MRTRIPLVAMAVLGLVVLSAACDGTGGTGTAPTIGTFSASPSTIAAGGSSTLSWTVSGTTPITLTIDQGVGDVSGSSSVSVSPAATTTYTLTAANSAGTTSKQTVVTVTASAPGIWGTAVWGTSTWGP